MRLTAGKAADNGEEAGGEKKVRRQEDSHRQQQSSHSPIPVLNAGVHATFGNGLL